MKRSPCPVAIPACAIAAATPRSDACTTSAMGVASIDALGPRGRGFHTKDEHIEVKTIIPKAQALASLLSEL